MSSHTYRNYPNNERRDPWYDMCNCCPYGYHIDLDFVRYCESVSQEADRTGSIKRRRDRRRRCQSREVLLGITPPVLELLHQTYKLVEVPKCPKIVQKQSTSFPLLIQDGFDDAVSDFERTLQRSKNKLSNNLPDVTAVTETIKRVPSNSSISSNSGSSLTVLPETANRDFDAVSIESCGLSSAALQNIREQMAISLERTKELEELVKQIPGLKKELVQLKDANLRLRLELDQNEDNKLNTITANYLRQFSTNNRVKSQSFTNIDSLDGLKDSKSIPRKDVGINCIVITRNIGVGNQLPNTKNVSTATIDFTDKWYNEKIKFLNDHTLKKIAIATQTPCPDKRTTPSQTSYKGVEKANQTSCLKEEKSFKSVGCTIASITRDFSAQKYVEAYNIGCSDDTIDDIVCERCLVPKCSIGTGPESSEDACTGPISLSILMGSRSKSFNLGDDKIDLKTRRRTVAVQYEPNNATKACQYEPNGVTKASQCEVKTQTKSCQREVKLANKNTQVERGAEVGKHKHTDTKDLRGVGTRSVACEAKDGEVEQGFDGKGVCTKCGISKDEGGKGAKDGSWSPTPSRIPRLQVPTTPVEIRKFRRQDTYTKLYSGSVEKLATSPPIGLSGLDLTNKPISAEPLETAKPNPKLPEATTTSAQNGDTAASPPTKVQIQAATLPIPETTTFTPFHAAHRKKAMPSKEMQGALKVLNDTLQKAEKGGGRHARAFNTNAIDIIQLEWFKISSLATANPLDVEDYLDAFEDLSAPLLQHIVNMTDDSGNTAMHYAVSHGNFDVVSILLDSKVCDINKPNKAGYTSVMLVSLAEAKSQTHANVVRRLFQLADVNIRAKQHGQTALMLAVSHGRLDMVKMLLEAGADINIQDEDGSTALMCAAEHGHTDIVKHFLSQPDCDSLITDIDNSTALKIAMEAEHRHIGVLLYAHQRIQSSKKKSKPASPRTPSSPLPIRSSHRALTDTKK